MQLRFIAIIFMIVIIIFTDFRRELQAGTNRQRERERVSPFHTIIVLIRALKLNKSFSPGGQWWCWCRLFLHNGGEDGLTIKKNRVTAKE
uniref:Putative secreted protein n=1 Tax=Anopheles darlingi TaxID=43151 RepID=A0A2M4DHB7_ANODA